MSLQYFFMLHPENIKYRIYFILKTKFKIIYFYYLLNEKIYNFFTSLTNLHNINYLFYYYFIEIKFKKLYNMQ